MKDIFIELFNHASNNGKFYISIPKKTIKIGKRYLLKEGEIKDGYKLDMPKMELPEILDEIEKFQYMRYRVSRPSARSNRYQVLFPAKKMKELSEAEYLDGFNREMCRAILEGTILCRIIDGSLYWDEEIMGGKLYWQSKLDEEFVLFRDFLGL